MIAHLSQLILLLSSVAVAQESTRVTGHFGKARIPIDFRFGEDVMVITSNKPVNGHDTFRETSNLHIFSRGIVAMRNSLNKECYIKEFNATMDGMKEKVKHALENNGDVGEVKEERVMVGGMQALGSGWMQSLFGLEIAEFCHLHKVYLLSGENSRLLDPKEISPQMRGRRAVANNSQRVSGGWGGQAWSPRPQWCPCTYWNGGYNSQQGWSRGRRAVANNRQGFASGVGRQALSSRRQCCPCRNWNSGRTSAYGFRGGPQMCPCQDYPRDILVAC